MIYGHNFIDESKISQEQIIKILNSQVLNQNYAKNYRSRERMMPQNKNFSQSLTKMVYKDIAEYPSQSEIQQQTQKHRLQLNSQQSNPKERPYTIHNTNDQRNQSLNQKSSQLPKIKNDVNKSYYSHRMKECFGKIKLMMENFTQQKDDIVPTEKKSLTKKRINILLEAIEHLSELDTGYKEETKFVLNSLKEYIYFDWKSLRHIRESILNYQDNLDIHEYFLTIDPNQYFFYEVCHNFINEFLSSNNQSKQIELELKEKINELLSVIKQKDDKIQKMRNYLNFANPARENKTGFHQVYTSEEVDNIHLQYKEKEQQLKHELQVQLYQYDLIQAKLKEATSDHLRMTKKSLEFKQEIQKLQIEIDELKSVNYSKQQNFIKQIANLRVDLDYTHSKVDQLQTKTLSELIINPREYFSNMLQKEDDTLDFESVFKYEDFENLTTKDVIKKLYILCGKLLLFRYEHSK